MCPNAQIPTSDSHDCTERHTQSTPAWSAQTSSFEQKPHITTNVAYMDDFPSLSERIRFFPRKENNKRATATRKGRLYNINMFEDFQSSQGEESKKPNADYTSNKKGYFAHSEDADDSGPESLTEIPRTYPYGPALAKNTKSKEGQRRKKPSVVCLKCDLPFDDKMSYNRHILYSAHHKACCYCNPAVDFETYLDRELHYKKCHGSVYCFICNEHFPTVKEQITHRDTLHPRCEACNITFETHKQLKAHIKLHKIKGKLKDKLPIRRGPSDRPLDCYAVLCISPQSSQDEIIKTAKRMRIDSHPDRLKRQEGLSEDQIKDIDVRAAVVGQAAEILSDPRLRQRHDAELAIWEEWWGGKEK